MHVMPINNLCLNKVLYDVCNKLKSWYTTISNYYNSNSEQINLNCCNISQNRGIQILPITLSFSLASFERRFPSFSFIEDYHPSICYVKLWNTFVLWFWLIKVPHRQQDEYSCTLIPIWTNIFPNPNSKFQYISSYMNNLK